MKKLILSTSLLAFTSLSSAQTQHEYSGHRVSLGANYATLYDFTNSEYSDYGGGLHLGYGYDINRIVGVNLEYDQANYSFAAYKEKLHSWKLSSEIGYAFIFNSWSIKPFGSVGLAYNNLDYKGYGFDGNESLGVSPLFGTGVRAELNNGLFAELKSNLMFDSDLDIGQVALSIGYKF